MDLTKRVKKGRATVDLGGDLTVAGAARLAGALREAFREAEAVRITIGDVRSADLSLLQLLCAAHRTARELDKEMVVTLSPGAGAVSRTVAAAGMKDHVRCTQSGPCLWSDSEEDGGGSRL